jgi:hypothetical protein
VTITRAVAGQTIKMPLNGTRDLTDMTVGPRCAGNTLGAHYCATHHKWFGGLGGNLRANAHYDEAGPHIAVWDCTEHGPEQP